MGIIRLTLPSETPKAKLAKDPNCSPDILEKLSSHKNPHVRMEVARNSNTPTSCLEQLSKDKDKDVRHAVALNDNAPAEILNALCEDNSMWVIAPATSNPNCPLETVRKVMAKDDNGDYSYGSCDLQYHYNVIAQREDCPADILLKIAESYPYIVDTPGASYDPSDELIKERVNIIMNHRNCNDEIAEALCKYGRAYVLYHEKCPKSILEKHSEDDDYIKSIIAERRDCPANILEKLSKDKNKDIRQTVAKNRNCPTRILNALINDPRKEVRVKALKNLKERNKGQHI